MTVGNHHDVSHLRSLGAKVSSRVDLSLVCMGTDLTQGPRPPTQLRCPVAHTQERTSESRLGSKAIGISCAHFLIHL